MKQEIYAYLDAISITAEVLHERIKKIYDFYKGVCKDDITDIMITEYLKEDGSREYESLWFFSEKYCMEAKQFITSDNFDMVAMKNRINYWKVQKQDYDFGKATERSRLTIYVSLGTLSSLDLKASKENCSQLKNIFL